MRGGGVRRLRPLTVVGASLLVTTAFALPSLATPTDSGTAPPSGSPTGQARGATGEPIAQAPTKPNDQADDSKSKSDPQTLPGGAKRGVLQGRITSVDSDEGAVVIAPADREEQVNASIARGVPVFVGGRLADRTALKEGQQVRASYEERDGNTRLRWIEVHGENAPNAPPGTGDSREGVEGSPGGPHTPPRNVPGTGGMLPIQRTAASGQARSAPDDAREGRDSQAQAPSTPSSAPQGSTGIHGDQIPGEQYEGETPEEQPAESQEEPQTERRGASGIGQTDEMFAPPMTPGERGQPGLNEVDGVVVQSNVADNELVIEKDGKHLTLRVPAGSPVIIEGRRGTLDSLVAGTPVRASLATEDESPIAVWVETIDRAP